MSWGARGDASVQAACWAVTAYRRRSMWGLAVDLLLASRADRHLTETPSAPRGGGGDPGVGL